MRVLPALATLTGALLWAGCGAERQDPPDLFAVKEPDRLVAARYADAGIRLIGPGNWRRARGEAPQAFQYSSGDALVIGWAYARAESLPRTDAELEAALERLEAQVLRRDPDFRVDRAQVVDVAGEKALEIEGEQEISKRPLHTRSVHVFKGEVEYVFEALAPPGDFGLVETKVFDPMLGSLELTGEVRRAGREEAKD